MSKQQTSLQDVNLNEDFNFFGEDVEEGVETIFESEEKEKKKEEEPQEEIEEIVFENFEEETGKPEHTEESEEDAQIFDAIKTIFESGYLELEEGQEITPENADEIYREKFRNAIENELAAVFNSYSPEVRDIIAYTQKGGDIQDYLETVKSKEIKEGMDMDSEVNQKKFMKYKLTNDGYTENEIEDEIERLTENGKLETAAKSHYRKWENDKKKEKENLKKQVADQEKRRRQEFTKTKESFTTYLKDANISEMKLSDKDRKELPDYILEPKYRLQNGTVISQFQKDYHDILQDKEKTIILAKILQSGADLKKIKTLVETKVVEEFEDKVKRTRLPNSKKTNLNNKVYNPLEYF